MVLISQECASYLLTTTSFQPLYGKLSDIFGRKSALLFSYTVFGIGCLGCGLARSMNELIAARVYTANSSHPYLTLVNFSRRLPGLEVVG